MESSENLKTNKTIEAIEEINIEIRKEAKSLIKSLFKIRGGSDNFTDHIQIYRQRFVAKMMDKYYLTSDGLDVTDFAKVFDEELEKYSE